MNKTQQDVLSADVVVVEHPGLFLRQDDDPAGTVGKSFEHRWLPALPHHRYLVGLGSAPAYLPSTVMVGLPGFLTLRCPVLPARIPKLRLQAQYINEENHQTVSRVDLQSFRRERNDTNPASRPWGVRAGKRCFIWPCVFR